MWFGLHFDSCSSIDVSRNVCDEKKAIQNTCTDNTNLYTVFLCLSGANLYSQGDVKYPTCIIQIQLWNIADLNSEPHCINDNVSDLSKAEELSEKLAAGLPAHITSQSFPWQVLVQIVAINLFAMSHAQQHADDSRGQNGFSVSVEDLTEDEENCFNLVFSLTGENKYHVYEVYWYFLDFLAKFLKQMHSSWY